MIVSPLHFRRMPVEVQSSSPLAELRSLPNVGTFIISIALRGIYYTLSIIRTPPQKKKEKSIGTYLGPRQGSSPGRKVTGWPGVDYKNSYALSLKALRFRALNSKASKPARTLAETPRATLHLTSPRSQENRRLNVQTTTKF